MAGWVTLSTSYDIGTVRAVLAFLLSVVSAAGTWIVAYAYWKAGATRALQSTSGTELLSLFSMATVGDALEALGVIRREMSRSLFLRLALQAAAVVALAMLGVLSGPLAQWSTRTGTRVGVRPVPGWLATPNRHNSMGGALVLWNATLERLRTAEFPLDRLPDFLPDNNVKWLFREEEWRNATWSATCTWTPLTPVSDVVATGNYSSGDLLDEVPALRSVVVPDPVLLQPRPFYFHETSVTSNYESYDYRKDVLIAFVAQQHPNSDFKDPLTGLPLVDPTTGERVVNAVANRAPLNLTLAAVHMRHVPAPPNSSAWFGSGAVDSAAFTRADCYLTRAIPPIDRDGDGKGEDDWSAYPWTQSPEAVTAALVNFHEAALISASFTGGDIPHPSGEELFRFYQAYTIAKDTQYRVAPSDARRLSVLLPSVEVSVAAAAMFGIIVTMLAAVALWSVLLGRYGGGVGSEKAKTPGMWVPRTKMEWIMEGVREVSSREPGGMLAADQEAERMMRRKLKTELATAGYGRTAAPAENAREPFVAEQLAPNQMPHSPQLAYVTSQAYTADTVSPVPSWAGTQWKYAETEQHTPNDHPRVP